jgi:hypothetical protein
VTVWSGYFVAVTTVSVAAGVPPDTATAVLAVGFVLLLTTTAVLAWQWERIGSLVLLVEGFIALIMPLSAERRPHQGCHQPQGCRDLQPSSAEVLALGAVDRVLPTAWAA